MSDPKAQHSHPITPLFVLVAALFVTTLITANIIAVKLIVIADEVLPAAIVIFPVSYILGDVLTEVFGFRRARAVIWLGFLCNLLAVGGMWVGGLLPAAGFWQENEAAYDTILGYTPRLLAASFTAYLIGEFANSIILSRMKVATKGRWLWMRTIGSTIVGQGLDSAIFITIAFAGEVPDLWRLVWIQWLAKVIYEVAATPLTYLVVTYLKRWERVDVYDRGVSLNPLPAFDQKLGRQVS
ncbi:MAG: queuosine precursor transporter [SAR202 cluster bacterium]|nr:queuosine precursor transporter [SAR202 cluster bacterium]